MCLGITVTKGEAKYQSKTLLNKKESSIRKETVAERRLPGNQTGLTRKKETPRHCALFLVEEPSL
jgi:hypothetical protein